MATYRPKDYKLEIEETKDYTLVKYDNDYELVLDIENLEILLSKVK